MTPMRRAMERFTAELVHLYADGVRTAVVDTCTSDFDTKLAVYSGTSARLVRWGATDDFCGLQSS